MALYIITPFGVCNYLFEVLAWFPQIQLQQKAACLCTALWCKVGPGRPRLWGANRLGVLGASLAQIGTLHPPPCREDGEGRSGGTQLVLSGGFYYGCLYNCQQVLGWKLATCGATHRTEPSCDATGSRLRRGWGEGIQITKRH